MDDIMNAPLTNEQAEQLRRLLPNGTPVNHYTFCEAAGLIKLFSSVKGAPKSLIGPSSQPTERQAAFLKKHGLWKDGLTGRQAWEMINQACERDKEEPGYLNKLA